MQPEKENPDKKDKAKVTPEKKSPPSSAAIPPTEAVVDGSKAREAAALEVKNVDFARKLNSIVSAIFSRCGVPIADFTVSEPLSFFAKVNYNLTWNFKCRASDKPAGKISDETHVLSQSGLDEFTQKNSKELEKESDITKAYIKRLAEAKFTELTALAGQIMAFNRISAIGRARCKKCHGSKKAMCEVCNGKGVISCPTCQGLSDSCSMCNGTGFINCDHCNGSGKVVCRACKRMGELIVEREIIYDSESSKDIEISLNVPGSDKTITSFSKEDEKIILEAANFDDQSLGSEMPHGYKATFIGYAPCFAVRVNLKGETTPFDFILCGKSLKPICKPPLLDVVFKEESNILSSTLNIGSDDVDEKIVCVKALAGKAILAKTIRSIENYELDIIKKEAAKQGVTVESILWENKNDLNNKARLIKSTVREQLIENVSLELISNAQGFISKEFSRYFAKNLIDFVPLLMMLNPNTKTVWTAVSLAVWLVNSLAVYFVPTIACIFLCIGLSIVVCAFTSITLTKNWTYYSAVSSLRIRHKLRKVPNLTSEAIHSVRLLFGTILINVVLFILYNYRGW